MTARLATIATCDRCNVTANVWSTDPVYVARRLSARGWREVKGLDLCPNCAPAPPVVIAQIFAEVFLEGSTA